MSGIRIVTPKPTRRKLAWLFQAAALASLLVLTLPCRGADARAIKSKVSPIYPEIAKRMKITGVVKLEVAVDPDGKVSDVKTLSGNNMLASAAQDAVRKWRFAPAPAASTVDVDMNFGAAE